MRLVPGAMCDIRQSGSPETRITISQFTFICLCALLISGCGGSDADLGTLGSLQGLARSYAGMASDAVKQSLIAQYPVATTIDGGTIRGLCKSGSRGHVHVGCSWTLG